MLSTCTLICCKMEFISVSNSSSDMENGLILFNQTVYPEVLCKILSHLPVLDIIRNCRLVCKYWKQIIDGHSMWKAIAIKNQCAIPKSIATMSNLPENIYKVIAVKNIFGRNLIKNPCGELGMDRWDLLESGGDGWIVENPPVGSDSLETIRELEGYSSCFATSYFWCSKEQKIDLWKEGCTKEIIKQLQPDLYICDWFCSRFDCSSTYRLAVQLFDEFSNLVDEYSYIEEHWIATDWTKVEKTFKLANSVRYVLFRHSGKDKQFWAGFYGSKMTGATVRLIKD